MYEYKKRQNNFARFILLLILIIAINAVSIVIYDMYTNIDMYEEDTSKQINASRISVNTEKNNNNDNDDDESIV